MSCVYSTTDIGIKLSVRALQRSRREDGIALLIALVGLALFSLLGFYMALNATTDLRVSDNYESHVQSRYAAQAGLNHARELLKGPRFDFHLKGPDGTSDTTSAYVSLARTFGFRNLVSWNRARSLNIFDPTSDVSDVPDDGLLNTGKIGATNGTILIPKTGIALTAPNPYGSGTITTSRYFVKVSDNNGEASELAGDAADNPFFDGDGVIVMRSIGVAQTINEVAGSAARKNSVAAFEARFKRRRTFDLEAPLVIQGNSVLASGPNMFDGNSFDIYGLASNFGIATIDVNTADGTLPSQQISSQVAGSQQGNIHGKGLEPSIQDITASISADADRALLLKKDYVWNFVNNVVPRFADGVYQGDQHWSGGSAPFLGQYDVSLPSNHASQNPRVTYVNGDLTLSGKLTGGGLLVVGGTFSGSGSFTFSGVILVIGEGELDLGSMNGAVLGGIFIANLQNSGGGLTWGTPKMTVAGNSTIRFDREAISMAVRLIPPSQVSWREVTSTMDPND